MSVISSSSTLADIFTADIDMDGLTTEVRSGVLHAIGYAFESLSDNKAPLTFTTTQVLCEAVNRVDVMLEEAAYWTERTGVRNTAHVAYLQEIHLTLKNALNA